VFKNGVLRKIFGPEKDEEMGEWSGLYSEDLYDVHSSPNIIQVNKSRRMKWVGHVAHMGDRRDL
jgi:hypothetical protein